MSAILEARGLGLWYGAKQAFGGVDLALAPHSITALVGPSGCGKSSLLNCLNRLIDLIPGTRLEGTVRFAGQDVYTPGHDVVTLRRRVGMIFQKPSPFPLSIRRNLEFPLKEHGVRNRRERADRSEQALRAVGLWDEVADRLGDSAMTLSGGQQQRLCIARTLALEPEVLLLDEPCSALDPLSTGVIEDLLHALQPRLTILVVTHNLAQARRLAERTAVFWVRGGVGCLVEQGPTAQIFDAPADPITAAYVSGARG